MDAPLTNLWSGYSLLQSTLKVEEIPGALRSRGFQTALLADFETLAGLEAFDSLMRDAGLFPLLGVSRVASFLGQDHMVHLVARSSEGWGSLVRFADWTGDAVPEETWLILEDSSQAWWNTGEFVSRFPEHVIVELRPDQRWLLEQLPPLWLWVPAKRVRFLEAEDQMAYHTLTKIGALTDDPQASSLPQTIGEFSVQYRDWPTERLFNPPAGPSVLPDRAFKMPTMDATPNEALLRLCEEGLAERLKRDASEPERERLHYELGIIARLGFAPYFLMVHDVVRWAKRVGIRVGPGRGSAAGSLVSYALHITDIHPLDYDLIFERFLNPERHSLPDIDLDFEDARRLEVIQYLRTRHGTDRVAQIGTYGTLGARAALRDVARVMGIPTTSINRVMSSIEWGINDKLQDHVDVLQMRMREEHVSENWLRLAEKLEGLPRHRSTHAAGVIISPIALSEVLYCHGDAESGWVTDFEMAQVERFGFVKLDVLGLRTLGVLSHIEKALAMGPEMMSQVDAEDEKTLSLLGRADTDGIFQLDGRGVKSLLRQMRPRSRQDIMVVVALYRPGPMDAISTYLERRRRGFTPYDALDHLLAETFGVFVYQEQLMSAVQKVAGFSMSEADFIRRAISKKDHQLLAREGERLMRNMQAKGHSHEEAEAFWGKLRAFGDYGFNKSHATAYGLLSYYLAYLKAHHPLHFWAGTLSHVESTERLKTLLVHAQSQGATISPPHINESDVDWTVNNGSIHAGLMIIRGLGESEADSIVEERRQRGVFPTLAAFEERVGRRLTPRALDALQQAGAFRGLGVRGRATQMSLFDSPLSRPSNEEPVNVAAALGFSWPVADGPIFVRLNDGVDVNGVTHVIEQLGERFQGSHPVQIIHEKKRVHRVPGVLLQGDMESIQQLKEIPGVSGAGRHVIDSAL